HVVKGQNENVSTSTASAQHQKYDFCLWTAEAVLRSMPPPFPTVAPRSPPMNLIQYFDRAGERAVAQVEGGVARRVNGATSVYSLAWEAQNLKTGGLPALVAQHGLGETEDIAALLSEGRMLAPIDHPDKAHLHVTGTGLTHLGSAATRDAMHKTDKPEGELTDSMKMFRMGLEGGKPVGGD